MQRQPELSVRGEPGTLFVLYMKTYFIKTLLLAFFSAATASAFSLYDTAPAVGLQESQAARYFASISAGYDTNPSGNGRSSGNGATFVKAALSTTYADVESIDKLSYSARLGGTRYLGGAAANNQVYSADCGMDISLTHAFSAMSRYTGTASLSYQPEPGYDNGITSQGLRGDTFTWTLNNSYASAFDSRWSWNISANYSGTQYEQKTNRTDDRQYLSASAGLNYKESELLTYTSTISFREEQRAYGMNSRSGFAMVGFQRALDPVSSVSFSAGTQLKLMDGDSNLYPTFDAGYRRRVSDGLSLNAYVKYSNENVDNYRSDSRSSYKNSPTWRTGVYGTYVLSPDVSFTMRMQLMYTSYSHSTVQGAPNYNRYSYTPALSMNYNFSPVVQGSISAEYSRYINQRDAYSSYNRWQFSTRLSYRF